MRVEKVVMAVLLAGGCASHHDGTKVESNDLGITEIEVSHEHVQDDQLLTVRGYDDEGATVATAVLRTGMVEYGADIQEALHAGTELKLTVGDTTTSFVSPDRVPHTIYESLSPGETTFVGLDAVANEIQQEAGIRFAPSKATGTSDELAYTAANCTGSRWPTAKGNPPSCCQDTTDTYSVNTSGQILHRQTYVPSWPSIPACRDSSGNTGCTSNCTYGPCGAQNVSVKGTSGGHVFHPTSQPNVCGWDDAGAGGLGTDYNPEHYAAQTLYGSVTATCLCTGCNADGTAQCGFHDDFTRSTGLGANWSVESGTFSTDGSNAKSTGAGIGNLARILSTYNTSDYALTTSVSCPTGSQENGVVARGGTNYGFVTDRYEAVLNTDSNDPSVQVFRINNESTYTVLGLASVTVTPGTFYTLKLVATGTNPVHLEAWYGATLEVVYDDYSASRLQSGNTGLVTWDSSTKWDYIDVTPAAQQGSPPPPPPGGSPFVDDFTRTSTLGLGTNWIIDGGRFTTNGTQTVSPAAPVGGNHARVDAALGTNDYAVTAVYSIPTTGDDSGVLARSADPDSIMEDTYSAWISTSGGGQIVLSRYDSWDETYLSNVATTINANTQYTVKLVATGTNPVHLEVWLNGVKKITYNDSDANRKTSGGHGIFSYVPVSGVVFESYRADAQ